MWRKNLLYKIVVSTDVLLKMYFFIGIANMIVIYIDI